MPPWRMVTAPLSVAPAFGFRMPPLRTFTLAFPAAVAAVPRDGAETVWRVAPLATSNVRLLVYPEVALLS